MDKKQEKKTPPPPAAKKPADTALVAASLTEMVTVDGQGQASGFENVRPGDTAVPFIYILQTLSPQVKKGMPQRIEGAEEGMLFNNVTLEVVQPPIVVIPCAFVKSYVEWVSRENGGGFVKQHPDESILKQCVKSEKNLDVLPNGNHVVPTAYHFVLVVGKDGKLERAVISMTRTQNKKSRRWLSQMMALQVKTPKGLVRPPMYSHSYEIGTALEQKDQYSWYGFTIGTPRMLTSTEQYLTARLFHQECVAGNVRVKEPEQEIPGAEATDSNVM